MENTNKFVSYNDERTLLLRPLNPIDPVDFEYVKVSPDPECIGSARFLHGTVYLSDLDFNDEDHLAYLDTLLGDFGYEGLDDFVEQNSTRYKLDTDPRTGKPDRNKSPDYVVDLALLASLIVESLEGGILTSAAKADDWVDKITHGNIEW